MGEIKRMRKRFGRNDIIDIGYCNYLCRSASYMEACIFKGAGYG